MTSIPVDIEKIIKDEGISLYVEKIGERLGPVSGYTRYENGKFHMMINADEVSWRQRFTMAHELAHIRLHGNMIREEGSTLARDDKSRLNSEIEADANRYAAGLLMPAFELMNEWLKEKDSLELAKKFNVSEAAMSARLHNLGLAKKNFNFDGQQ